MVALLLMCNLGMLTAFKVGYESDSTCCIVNKNGGDGFIIEQANSSFLQINTAPKEHIAWPAPSSPLYLALYNIPWFQFQELLGISGRFDLPTT